MRQKPLRYFYYRGDLHKKIHINRGEDLIVALHCMTNKPVKYIYSDVRKNGERAFSTKQVAEMVDRTPMNLMEHVSEGRVERPQFYTSAGGFVQHFWCEDDIMALHSFLKTVHIGRPRRDGEINTRRLPSTAELRAMIRQGTVLYVKNSKGEFVPTWQAENF